MRASAYHFVLGPEVIDDLRLYGYCLVVTFGVVRERALGSGAPARAPTTSASSASRTIVREFSPYDEGADPVPFDFDLSYNLYPPEYERPGPDRCASTACDDCEPGHRVRPSVRELPRAKEPARLLAERAERPQRVALEVAVHGARAAADSQSVAYSAYISARSAHQVPTGSGPPLQEPAE